MPDEPWTTAVQLLVARCNQGDSRAWEEFYSRYHGMISCAVKRYAGRGSDDLEDMTHEVFIHLFKALKNYDPNKPIEAYVLEIGRRVGISRFRKASALKRGGMNPRPVSLNAAHPGYDGPSLELASPQEDQEGALIRAQETLRVRNALSKLSENCRRLLFLRYDQNLSYKEISVTLQVNEGALRVRVQRCLSALAANYSEGALQEAGDR